MRIPVVLPRVSITVDAGGVLALELDHKPYLSDRDLVRSDVGAILEEITTSLATPVRVEITEAEGTTYTDIATPPEQVSDATQDGPELREVTALPSGRPGGDGFLPGEQVAIAYVVLKHRADATGAVQLRLPPALVHRGIPLVMVGLESRAISLIEQHGSPAPKPAVDAVADAVVEAVA